MPCENGSLGFVFKSGILNFARFLENEEMDAFAIFLNEKGLARNSGYELLLSKHEI